MLNNELPAGTEAQQSGEADNTTSSQTIGNTHVVGSDVKTGIGVFCQCGGIIYAVTDDCYKRDKQSRKEADNYFQKGYRMGKVSKQEVQELFGCKCKHTAPKLF